MRRIGEATKCEGAEGETAKGEAAEGEAAKGEVTGGEVTGGETAGGSIRMLKKTERSKVNADVVGAVMEGFRYRQILLNHE